MNITASIIAAVSYLHGHQPPIIHGDIKPTNIIMPKAGGRAVLVDFGTAKRYDLDSLTTTVRSCYRAPEQYTTGPDLQSDIYSLGAIFYTLMTGIVPPNSPSRLKQVSKGEIDPLQPVNEVLPTVPASVARAIDRAMSLDADNRFLSVERFWEALWSLVEYPSTVSSNRPSASSHPPMIAKPAVVRPAVVSVPKQPRPPRAWKFGPFWPFAPKQAVAGPATVSIAKYRRPPRPSIPAVTEQPAEEPAPASVAEQPPPVLPSEPAVTEQAVEEPTPVSVAEQPLLALPSEPAMPEQEVAEPAPALVAEQLPPVSPLEPAIAEQVVEEPTPTIEPTVADEAVEESALVSVTEHLPPVPPSEPALQEQAVEEPAPTFESALTEQVVEELAPVSVAEQPRMAPTFVAERPVEKSARASVAKPPRAPRTWRLVVLLIVLVLVVSLGISADISSHVFTQLAASATSTPSSFRPTPTPVPTTYPTLAGTYKGTIFDIPANVRTSLTFTDVRQNRGHISGYLTVGPGLLGYGSFSGTINAAKQLQFTVTDTDGNPTLFFEGEM